MFRYTETSEMTGISKMYKVIYSDKILEMDLVAIKLQTPPMYIGLSHGEEKEIFQISRTRKYS